MSIHDSVVRAHIGWDVGRAMLLAGKAGISAHAIRIYAMGIEFCRLLDGNYSIISHRRIPNRSIPKMAKRKREQKERLKEHTLPLEASAASALLEGVEIVLQLLASTWQAAGEGSSSIDGRSRTVREARWYGR